MPPAGKRARSQGGVEHCRATSAARSASVECGLERRQRTLRPDQRDYRRGASVAQVEPRRGRPLGRQRQAQQHRCGSRGQGRFADRAGRRRHQPPDRRRRCRLDAAPTSASTRRCQQIAGTVGRADRPCTRPPDRRRATSCHSTGWRWPLEIGTQVERVEGALASRRAERLDDGGSEAARRHRPRRSAAVDAALAPASDRSRWPGVDMSARCRHAGRAHRRRHGRGKPAPRAYQSEKLVGDINRQIGSIDAALAAANDRFSSTGDRITANIDEKIESVEGPARRAPTTG